MAYLNADRVLLDPYPAEQHKDDSVAAARSSQQPVAHVQEHGREGFRGVFEAVRIQKAAVRVLLVPRNRAGSS